MQPQTQVSAVARRGQIDSAAGADRCRNQIRHQRIHKTRLTQRGRQEAPLVDRRPVIDRATAAGSEMQAVRHEKIVYG